MSPFLSQLLLLLLLFARLSFSHNFLNIPHPAPPAPTRLPNTYPQPTLLPLPCPLTSSSSTRDHIKYLCCWNRGPIAQTHTLLSAVLLRCVCEIACVYYLYIRWFSASAGIANMFLNISCEIVWNSLVSDDNDSLTALSGPWRFHDNTHSLTHTKTHSHSIVWMSAHEGNTLKHTHVSDL